MHLSSATTRAQRAAAAQRELARRQRIAEELAANHGGVVTRAMLAAAGLSRGQVRSQVERGLWRAVGRHTLSITAGQPGDEAFWWRAVWESGSRAVLDGPTALLAGGLSGWRESLIHVSVPNGAHVRDTPGVRHHFLRDIGPTAASGLPRTRPAVALVRAAQWARSDRAAATLVAMGVQQGLVSTADLLARWGEVHWSTRRTVLDEVIADVCDGAQSMSELDFASLCRDHGLPEPTRQAMRSGRSGRVFLDVFWEELGVHVEIQGAQHFLGLAGVDDALRFNDLQIRQRVLVSLQIPVLGLRTRATEFMAQVARALAEAATIGAGGGTDPNGRAADQPKRPVM